MDSISFEDLGARWRVYVGISLVRGSRGLPIVFANKVNRPHQDDWLAQLPTPPYPPMSGLQQADTSLLEKPKQQSSEISVYPHPESVVGNQLPPHSQPRSRSLETWSSKIFSADPFRQTQKRVPNLSPSHFRPAWNSSKTLATGWSAKSPP